MSKQISTLDLLVDLSIEEQQILSGGQDTPGGVSADLEDSDEEPVENGEIEIPEEDEIRPRQRQRQRQR